jgi:2-oxoisovalerate dehydrogenase E1 component
MGVIMSRLDKSTENLLKLYRDMYRLRLFEDTAAEKYKSGEIPGFVHLYQGEEAVAAGVCAALKKEDVVTSTHRGHGHAVAKGVPVREALAELFGKQGGCNGGRGGSMHMYKLSLGFLGTNGMVGGGIGLAVGAGLSSKLLKKGAVGVTFFGDGASNMGICYESFNMASYLKLPVIFVCENNKYATATSLEMVAANPEVASRASAFAMKGVAVDGNDIIAVYEAAAEARERAVNGLGPTLIECKTYRHGGHYLGDQLYGTYRTKEEVDTWMLLKDPIQNFKVLLKEVYAIEENLIKEAETAVEKEMEEAYEYAKSSPLPDPSTVGKHLFWEGG